MRVMRLGWFGEEVVGVCDNPRGGSADCILSISACRSMPWEARYAADIGAGEVGLDGGLCTRRNERWRFPPALIGARLAGVWGFGLGSSDIQ